MKELDRKKSPGIKNPIVRGTLIAAVAMGSAGARFKPAEAQPLSQEEGIVQVVPHFGVEEIESLTTITKKSNPFLQEMEKRAEEAGLTPQEMNIVVVNGKSERPDDGVFHFEGYMLPDVGAMVVMLDSEGKLWVGGKFESDLLTGMRNSGDTLAWVPAAHNGDGISITTEKGTQVVINLRNNELGVPIVTGVLNTEVPGSADSISFLAGRGAEATPTDTAIIITPTSTETPTVAPTNTAEAIAPQEVLLPITIVKDLEHLSQVDVVKDGEGAEYAKRVLAAYQRGEIQNFSADIVPAVAKLEDNSRFRDQRGYGGDFTFNYNSYQLADAEKRPFKGVALVQDGNGGFRMIQIWLQKDGTVGIVWYHITKDALKSPVTTDSIKAMFGDPRGYPLPEDFKDSRSCTARVRDAQFCQIYMSDGVTDSRSQALNKWVSDGIIPKEIQSGEIQFFPSLQGA